MPPILSVLMVAVALGDGPAVTIDKPPGEEITRVESPARLTVDLGRLDSRNGVWQTRKLASVSVAGARLHSVQIAKLSQSARDVRLRLISYVLLEPGTGDKDVYLTWEFLDGTEKVAVRFTSREYIGASDRGIESEVWKLTMSRDQFDRVFTESGKLRLTVDVRPEA